MVIKVR
ncbi:hypothetical protein Zm00014a_004880 [Zea mays]|nr:hypothetical protein Zm00014a_004880 [Zea mays]